VNALSLEVDCSRVFITALNKAVSARSHILPRIHVCFRGEDIVEDGGLGAILGTGELDGQKWTSLLHKDDVAPTLDAIHKSKLEKSASHNECYVIARFKKERHMSPSVYRWLFWECSSCDESQFCWVYEVSSDPIFDKLLTQLEISRKRYLPTLEVFAIGT